MKTKNWYVFAVDEGVYGLMLSYHTSMKAAKVERADNARYGYPVSPIVKVAVPVPEVKP